MYKFNEEKLEYEKINYFLTPVGIFLIFICLFFVMGFTLKPTNPREISQEEKLIVIREYNGFTEQALVTKISSINFKFPYIVLAQTYQETGHYKSVIFKENNNIY